jgi:hypothetical protein
MSWHYQVRQAWHMGVIYFDIVEVYTNPTGWTKDSIAAAAESYEGVIETLEHMLADAKKYPVLIDEAHE